jgi:phage anti-repressor protein
MPDLIPFATRQLGSDTVNTVTARDLHDYLDLTKDYTSWIKVQLKRAHLIENEDYIVFTQKVEGSLGGRPQSEYHLTFDAAKHVALMSNAAKGHEVRAWFIAKEKELAALTTAPKASERFPELRAIAQLVEATAEARLLAEQAQARAQAAEVAAVRAESKADLALNSQAFFTIAEYVYINKLQRQLPESAYRAASDHLRLYCLDNRLPVRKQAVADKKWPDEYAFHEDTYAEAFVPWLARRSSQVSLRVMPGREDVR